MINEEKIKVNGEIELGATIACSNDALLEFSKTGKKMPLVLIIAGTGSLDRDGNSMMIKLNVYKELSDFFAGNGYACVRYDKRGTHESKGKALSQSLTTLTNDAKSVIEHCKQIPYVDTNNIIVCGHSEGSMIATLLTEKTGVDKIILLGGAGMSLKDAMLFQTDTMLTEAKEGSGVKYWLLRKLIKEDKAKKQIDDLYEKAEKSKKSWFFYRGGIMPTTYIKEHNQMTSEAYLEILKRYQGDILAITGTADLQADYKRLETLQELPNATTYAPENINHMLKKVSGNNSIIDVMKQYQKQIKIKQSIDAELLDYIKTWLDNSMLKSAKTTKCVKNKASEPINERVVDIQVQEKE